MSVSYPKDMRAKAKAEGMCLMTIYVITETGNGVTLQGPGFDLDTARWLANFGASLFSNRKLTIKQAIAIADKEVKSMRAKDKEKARTE